MANIIELLPDSVANQIAAGEVIQRPASVVKELVENAIDAGATKVDVIIKDAGRTLIQVIDNGCGMSGMDARMSFERHATSKIRQASDLFAIRTMGFRGEALASIAAVAQVELKTRLRDEETGHSLRTSGSIIESVEACSCASGSSFLIKNLFYNIPVRRKFLKSNSTEFKYIVQEFQRIALCFPEVELNLYDHDEEVFRLQSGSRMKRIEQLFRKNINQQLIPLQTDTSIIKISGFIGKPEHAKKSPGEQYFFVNQRFMKHPFFQKAVITAYERLLPADTLPSYFIYFDINPDAIDVNIHPTKTEIKFEDENNIWRILNLVVKESLGKFNIVPSLDFEITNPVSIPALEPGREVRMPEVRINPNYNPFESAGGPSAGRAGFTGGTGSTKGQSWEELYSTFSSASPQQERLFTEAASGKEEMAGTEVAGRQFFIFRQKYLITSLKSGLILIDKRRAHIRILFEKYLNELNTRPQLAQPLLFPEEIQVSQEEALSLRDILPRLQQLGFRIQFKDDNRFMIHSLPENMANYQADQLIRQVISHFREENQNEPELPINEKMAYSLALSTAVGDNDSLKPEETEQLIRDLFLCKSTNYTPSGKKILHILTADEVENLFKK